MSKREETPMNAAGVVSSREWNTPLEPWTHSQHINYY